MSSIQPDNGRICRDCGRSVPWAIPHYCKPTKHEESGEDMCASKSPRGNACMFIADHEGKHEIQHMLGEETWDDERTTSYFCELDAENV